MKSFFQFISEATASQQATRLGLVGDGHGGWYDKEQIKGYHHSSCGVILTEFVSAEISIPDVISVTP